VCDSNEEEGARRIRNQKIERNKRWKETKDRAKVEEAFAFNRSLANLDAISRGFGTELCTREFGFRGRNLKQAFHQALRSAMRRRSVDFSVV
jgi:hypothetical protein